MSLSDIDHTGRYFAPDGSPMEQLEWAEMFEKRHEDMAPESWWRKHTVLDDDEVRVSTVWLGLNHRWGEGPPLIWETMIFGGPHSEDQWRYSTKERAFDEHERIVAALRAGEDPNIG